MEYRLTLIHLNLHRLIVLLLNPLCSPFFLFIFQTSLLTQQTGLFIVPLLFKLLILVLGSGNGEFGGLDSGCFSGS